MLSELQLREKPPREVAEYQKMIHASRRYHQTAAFCFDAVQKYDA